MTNLKITNNTDYDNATEGLIAASQVRSVEVEALVDTGATMLACPKTSSRPSECRMPGTAKCGTHGGSS